MNFLDLFVSQCTFLVDQHRAAATDFRLKSALRSGGTLVRRWVAMAEWKAFVDFGSMSSSVGMLEA